MQSMRGEDSRGIIRSDGVDLEPAWVADTADEVPGEREDAEAEEEARSIRERAEVLFIFFYFFSLLFSSLSLFSCSSFIVLLW